MMEKYFLGKLKKDVSAVLDQLERNDVELGSYVWRTSDDQVVVGEGSLFGTVNPIPPELRIVVGKNTHVGFLRIDCLLDGKITIGDNCYIQDLTIGQQNSRSSRDIHIEIGDGCKMRSAQVYTGEYVADLRVGANCRFIQPRLKLNASMTIGERVYLHNVAITQGCDHMSIGADTFIGCSKSLPDGIQGLSQAMDWSNLVSLGDIGKRSLLLCGNNAVVEAVGDDVTYVQNHTTCFPRILLYDGAVLASVQQGYGSDATRKEKLVVGRDAVATISNVYYNESVTVHPGVVVAL